MQRRLDPGLLLALLLPVILVLPLVPWSGIPNTADGVIHVLRQVDFDRAVRAGVPVPRWGADLYLGFGYPLYNFAPPLLAYLVEILSLGGLATDAALALVVILIVELYSVGMFLFMRPKVGTLGALAAAALNVYAPFRLREALVTGGNYPQFLAMALFPLCLWAFDGLVRTRRPRYGVAAALSYAALWLSHLFHAAVFSPVLTLFVCVRLIATRARRGAWFAALGAGLAGIALSAFFWAPALLEARLTGAVAEQYIAASDYHQRFLTWSRLLAPPAPLDFAEANADVPLALGWPQLAAGALGLVAVAYRRRGASDALFLLTAGIGANFLQTPGSAPLWEAGSFLPVAEFPWRFMGIAVFALAALGGYAVTLVPPRARTLAAMAIVGAAMLAALPYAYAPRGYARLGTPTVETVAQYENATGAHGLTTINEYLPRTVQELPADRPAPLGRTKIDLSASQIVADRWSPRGENVTVNMPAPARVRFRTFYFPDWTAAVDGMSVPSLTIASDGTFSVDVPAGQHVITTQFGDTPVRTAAGVVSIAGLLALALAMWRWPFGAATQPESGEHIGRSAWMACVGLIAVLLIAKIEVDVSGGLRGTPRSTALAVFGGQMELVGSAQDETAIARSADLHARFYWRPAQPLTTNYRVIAQLIGPDGRAAAGSDKQHPGDPVTQGETPTSQIAEGKYLRDEHTIRVPDTALPGRYELRVGLYDPQTGRRLQLPDGGTLFAAGTVDVR